MLCGWGVKAGMACLQVKLCVAISEHFGKCYNVVFKSALQNVQVYFTYCRFTYFRVKASHRANALVIGDFVQKLLHKHTHTPDRPFYLDH